MLTKNLINVIRLSIVIILFIILLMPNLLLAQKLPDAIDPGYAHLPRSFVDVNGDSRIDYCRFVGNPPNIFIACALGTANGFDVASQFSFRSISGIDQGYQDRPRVFRDVNGDGRADFCRFVQVPGDVPLVILEACDLATPIGFDPNQYRYRPANRIIGLEACNDTSMNISVAYAFPHPPRFVDGMATSTVFESRGWWNIDPYRCKLIYPGAAWGIQYIFAKSGTRSWGKDPIVSKFCVKSEAFAIFPQDEDKCSSSGGEMVEFKPIDVRGQKFRSFSFNE